MIITIGVPWIAITIMHSVFKSWKKGKIDRVNKVIIKIYRHLIRYKSGAKDFYHNDLKYKDQGLISFWMSKLKEAIEFVSFENRKKLTSLMLDLQKKEFSVVQKIDLINLAWGSVLFTNSDD